MEAANCPLADEWVKKIRGGLVSKLCPTLCNPMDCSLPGSSVYGISQARILECGAISSSRTSVLQAVKNLPAMQGNWV